MEAQILRAYVKEDSLQMPEEKLVALPGPLSKFTRSLMPNQSKLSGHGKPMPTGVMILAAWERESIWQRGQSCHEVVQNSSEHLGQESGKSPLHWCEKKVAPVQKRVCTSTRDYFLTLAPEAQKNF